MNSRPPRAEPLVRRSRLHTWLAARPRVLDVVVILACVVPQIAALSFQAPPHEWLAQLCVAGVAVALWWRRSHPLAVLLVVSVLAALNPLYHGSPNVGSFEIVFAAYALAVHTRLRTAVLGYLASGVLTLVISGVAYATGLRAGSAIIGLQLLPLIALVIGVAVRARNARRAALEELAVMREERAVSAERARITAEMHDVVAHSASVMIALAGGARAGWEKHPERARAALEQLGTVGAQALEEMQRTLRVLREGDAMLDAGLARSGHNIPSFEELVEVFRAAGLRVELSVPAELPGDPVLRTTLYRIVQEALTNALRHAAGATLVTADIEWAGDAITVTVTDDGGTAERVDRRHHAGAAAAGATAGFGLRAMRERTAAFGGSLEAGPLPVTGWAPRGGWRTRATLPLAFSGTSDG